MKSYPILLSLLLAGCATPDSTPKVSVGINTFSRPGSESKKTYVLLPADQNRKADDLEFIEYSTYLERALTARGYHKADFGSAELAIFLAYGIGAPAEHKYTYTLPVFGQTGVASSTTTGSVNVFGNTGTYSQTTTNTPQYGITGYSKHEGSVTTFTRHTFITAYDLAQFRETKVEQVAWETRIASVGSSGDLRYVFPLLIAASRPYFGVSTGKIVDAVLHIDDPAVFEIRGLPVPPDKAKK